MRKIFLTSGLVVCMACPAFADLGPNGNIMTGTGDQATESNNPATCQYPTLQGHSGTSTFTAKWGKNWYAITLNSNTGTTTATGGDSEHVAAPTPLFTMKGQSGVYQTRTNNGTDQNPDYQFSNWVAVDQTAVDVLTTDPRGITVNYDVRSNKPSTASTTFETEASSTGGQRAFLGFFADASSSTALIDSTGALTPTGASVASGLSADTSWVAHWDLVQPTVTQPVLPGYHFEGWATTATAQENETLVSTATLNSTKIGQDTLYFARWSAENINITFNCGKPVAGQPIPGGSGNYAVGASENTSADPSAHAIAMDASGYLTETCTLPGWTFDGWSCTEGLTTDAGVAIDFITAEQLATVAENNTPAGYQVLMKNSDGVTCTAKWTQNNIGLTWQGNGGTVTGGGETCSYDGNITLPSAVTRPGYTFEGWTVSNPNE